MLVDLIDHRQKDLFLIFSYRYCLCVFNRMGILNMNREWTQSFLYYLVVVRDLEQDDLITISICFKGRWSRILGQFDRQSSSGHGQGHFKVKSTKFGLIQLGCRMRMRGRFKFTGHGQSYFKVKCEESVVIEFRQGTLIFFCVAQLESVVNLIS